MGSPKRNRKKYEKPKDRWNLERIKSDQSLISEYGLKSSKELWKVQTEISRIRRNVREQLAGGTQYQNIKEKLIARLTRYGIANPNTTLDDLLDLNERVMLDRRLQTIVFKKGLARSIRQARQLTVHGFIAINGKRVNRPGYLVDVEDEKHLGYYKPIDVTPPAKQTTPSTAEETTTEQGNKEQAS